MMIVEYNLIKGTAKVRDIKKYGLIVASTLEDENGYKKSKALRDW